MVIIIDEEYIDGIKMCNQIQFLFEERLISCTFNFNINEKWIKFYLTLNQKIGIHQMSTALIILNSPIKNLRRKGWSRFHKIYETKWFNVKWKPLYSYRIRSSKIIEQIQEEIKLICDEELDNVVNPKYLPPEAVVPPPIDPHERLKQKTKYKETFTFE